MIFFDLDDTLLNHSLAEAKAAELFGQKYAARIPGHNQFFPEKWHEVTERYMERFLRKELTIQEQRRLRIREIFQWDCSGADADRLFHEYIGFYESNWQLFPDVLECLNRLSAFKLGVITDGGTVRQHKKLATMGIASRFDVILTAEESSYSKPNPAFFAEACHLAQKDPSDCWYIGDNLRKDAIGASDAGLRGIWLNRKPGENNHSVETCDSLHTFCKLLLGS